MRLSAGLLLLLAACSSTSDAPSSASADGGSSADAGSVVTPPSGTSDDGGADAGSVATLYFPPASGTWETAAAATAGFDDAKLDEVVSFAGSTKATTFLMLYDGRILREQYWGATATTNRDIASAQKSITSLLVGIAQQRFGFHREDTVTSLVGSGWSNATPEQEAPITLQELLTMTSGLDASLGYAAPAGTAWLYNTDAYHRLELVLEGKSGVDLQTFTRSALFDPIGVGTSQWVKRQLMVDAKGNPESALEMNARDMARIGLLVQAGGTWSGVTVVPSDWLGAALTPSQTLNPSYGLLWWLNGQPSVLLPPSTPATGPLVPAAPADLVAALGAGDQKIYVSRSSHLVVVRQGPSASTGTSQALSDWDNQLWTKIVAARK